MNESSFRNVLKNSQFVFLWTAQIFSQFSDKVLFLFMVDLVTKDQFSNSKVSILTLVFTIPAVLFGSVAGVFVDRFNKKKIMIISNVFRSILVAMMLLSNEHFYLYLLAFLVSTFTQFFAPAETSMIPDIVEKNDLMPANSLFTTTMLSSVVLGFALGAPIINKYGEFITGITISTMYLLSVLLLLLIKSSSEKSKDEKKKEPFIKEFKEGMFYVFKNKVILFSMIRLVIMFSAFAALSVLVIGFVNDILEIKPVYFGYILAMAGIGMGLGALLTGKFGNRIGKNALIFNGFIFSGISLIVLANTSAISNLLGFENQNFKIFFAFFTALITGFSASLCVIPLQTLLQEITEESMRGKVFGVQNMAVNTAMTVPMALSGFLADFLDGKIFGLKGVVTVIMIIGIIVFLGGFIDLFFNRKQKDLLIADYAKEEI